MKKNFYIYAFILGALLVASALPVAATIEREGGNWMLVAPSPMVFTCGGGTYAHTLNTVSQQENGDFTGTGSYDANSSYTWNITGNVTGSDLTFTLVYTGTNPGYTLHGTGTIGLDGTIHGTTDGNCQLFDMDEGSASNFTGNHGQYVRSQEDKRTAAHSRIGMPVQSKGHSK